MRALVFFACLAAACAADRGLDGQRAVEQPIAPQNADVCLTDGSFDFHVYGDTLAAWNGMSIVATALEPQADGSAVTRIPVRLGSRVSDGSFSIACPSSLRANNWYPSYALYIDANRDGLCDDGDQGLLAQRFGWDQSIDDRIGISPDETFGPVDQPQRGIGSAATTFCQAYFP